MSAREKTTTQVVELDTLLEAPEVTTARDEAQPAATALVGECVDAAHPTLVGRALVRWVTPDGREVQRWLSTLHGLPVRAGDRVLLTRPANWPDAIVTGVVDGFAKRPEVERAAAASLTLQRDEALRVVDARGAPLVEVRGGDAGPTVRLLTDDASVELAGGLTLSAERIELVARQGAVRIAAHDDVVVRGEHIKLN